MTVTIHPLGNDGFLIHANDLKKRRIVVSGKELGEISEFACRHFLVRDVDHMDRMERTNSERKQLINRLSYLEAWKKRSISNTQRVFANLNNRLHKLEAGLADWDNATYTALRSRVEQLEEMFKTSPSRLTQDARIADIGRYTGETRQYIGGELDTITKYIADTKKHVTELERRNGLSEMFHEEQSKRLAVFEGKITDIGNTVIVTKGIYNNLSHNQIILSQQQDKQKVSINNLRDIQKILASEHDKQQTDIKHLNGRLRTVEEKQVSADIKKDVPVKGSLAEAMSNNIKKAKQYAVNKNNRDAKGKFVKRTTDAKRS